MPRIDAPSHRSAVPCGARSRRAAAEGFRLALRGGRAPAPYPAAVAGARARADKRRFLRHLRSWWEIHRHRIAPSVAAQIDGRARARHPAHHERPARADRACRGRPARDLAATRRGCHCSSFRYSGSSTARARETDYERVGRSSGRAAGRGGPRPALIRYRLGSACHRSGRLDRGHDGRPSAAPVRGRARLSAGHFGRSSRSPTSAAGPSRSPSPRWTRLAGRDLVPGPDRRAPAPRPGRKQTRFRPIGIRTSRTDERPRPPATVDPKSGSAGKRGPRERICRCRRGSGSDAGAGQATRGHLPAAGCP